VSILNSFQMRSMKMNGNVKSIQNKEFEYEEEL
jgi:hypothetical protein